MMKANIQLSTMCRFKSAVLLWVMGILAGMGAMSAQGAASTRTYGFMTFTNFPTQYHSYVVDGQTIWWVTNVTTNASQVLITNTTAGLRTNVYVHTVAYPFTNNVEVAYWTNSTTLVFAAQSGRALSITTTGNWASVTYRTNVTYDAESIPSITNGLTEAQVTNMGSTIVKMLEKSTNALSDTNTALSGYASVGQAQTISNKVVANSLVSGGTNNGVIITNAPLLHGTNQYLAGGVLDGNRPTNQVGMHGTLQQLTGGVLDGNRHTNVVGLHGTNRFLSGGTLSTNVIQGASVQGGTFSNVAVVSLSINPDDSTWAYNFLNGTGGTTNAQIKASANGWAKLVAFSTGTAFDATAAPDEEEGAIMNWYSIKQMVPMFHVFTGVESNQWTIDNYFASGVNRFYDGLFATNVALDTVTAQGVGLTNSLLAGTNKVTGDLSFPMYSMATLANGNNVAVPATNFFIAVSGPSATFTICGLQSFRDGKMLRLYNKSGQTMTIANESGVDPTPGNRIATSTGGDVSYGPNAKIWLEYDPLLGRWTLDVPTNLTVTVTATNALGTLRTNGTAVTTALTNLNVLAGSNMVVKATNANGTVDLEINGPQVPTAFAYDKQFSTNGGTVTITNGAVVTNLAVNPLNASSPALRTTNASGQTASQWEIRESNGALIGGVSNGIPFMSVSNSGILYPACIRIFNQNQESQATNITTTATSLFGSGAGGLMLTNNFWQVGRGLEVKIRGTVFTTASPGNVYFSVRCGTTEIATNIYVIAGSLSGQFFELSATITCRTNSGSVGYLACQGLYNSASTGDAERFAIIKNAGAIFDTTAANQFDVIVTNGASTTGFRTQTATVTLLP